MKTYIIDDWNQIQYIPENEYSYCLNVIKFNTKNQKGITINIIKDNIIICSLLVDYVTDNKDNFSPYVYNKTNALHIINSFGFNILFYNDIELNEEEINILYGIYKLGYSYIQLINIDTINKVVVSKQQLNSYSTTDEYIDLHTLTNYSSNCFKWMENLISYSIPTLLNISDGGCDNNGSE